MNSFTTWRPPWRGNVTGYRREQTLPRSRPLRTSLPSLQGDVLLTEHGGPLGRVLAVEYPAPSAPLIDLSLRRDHASIAVPPSQRFHGIVAFPVGFDERVVTAPTVPGETYCCRVLPVSTRKDVPERLVMIRLVVCGASAGGENARCRGDGSNRWIQKDGVESPGDATRTVPCLSVVEDAAVFDFAHMYHISRWSASAKWENAGRWVIWRAAAA